MIKYRKLLHNFTLALANISLLINSLFTPLYVYAQEITPDISPSTEQTTSASPTLAAEASPVPTNEPQVSPTNDPAPSPVEQITPTITSAPEVSLTLTPEPFPSSFDEPTPTSVPDQENGNEDTENPEVTPTETPSVEASTNEENAQIAAMVVSDVSASSIAKDEVVFDGTGMPQLQTDKADYAPTDVVLITGSGFEVNKEYDLVITGTGDFRFDDKVKSDQSGGLFYTYQLDGTYRPDYKVEILEVVKSEVLQSVASVTFTDTNDKVKICHSTSSTTNPYNIQNPSKSGDVEGHDDHDGGIYPINPWGDIIPPFTFKSWEVIGTEMVCPNGYPDESTIYPGYCHKHNKHNYPEDYRLKVSQDVYGWVNHNYPGKNFTLVGEEIWNNECEIPLQCGESKIFEKTGDFSNSEININFEPGNKISVNAPSGYEINNIWLDVKGDAISGYYLFDDGPISHANPPGDEIKGVKVEVLKVCAPVCGNSRVETSEQCDDGAQNGVICVPEYGGNCNYCSMSCQTQTVIGGYCGDGTKGSTEQCDGNDGITPGSNFCSAQCTLIPKYDGESSCPSGTVKSQNPVASVSISSQNPNSTTVSLPSSGKYLFEASGTFIPTSSPGYLADAGYTLYNGSLAAQYGIQGSGNDYGAHALLADLGSGMGVLNWGNYSSEHIYSRYYDLSINNPQFVIGDRYGNWFNTPYQNQAGMNDNSGSLNLNVYRCESTGSITITKDSQPDDSQDFIFERSFGENFVLDDDSNASLPKTITFSNLNPGNYSVKELDSFGWFLTNISCTGGSTVREGKTIKINLGAGENVSCIFNNQKTGTIVSYKYEDANKNGHFDTGEVRPDGWEITLYDTSWNKLKSMFTGDDTTEAGNVETGHFTFKNLTPATYYVCETLKDGWKQSEPSSGYSHEGGFCRRVTLSAGGLVYGIPFGNYRNPVKIDSKKVVCDNEQYLPNWGNHGSVIGANTAQAWVDQSNEHCKLEDQWEFQWGPAGAGSFDDFQTRTTEMGSPWTTISMGVTEINDISNLGGRIEMREFFQDGYSPLVAFSNAGDVSAEFYCSGDVYNYDNWEWISSPQYGTTYYCVGFNALSSGDIRGSKFEDADRDGVWGEGETGVGGWTIFIDEGDKNGVKDVTMQFVLLTMPVTRPQ